MLTAATLTAALATLTPVVVEDSRERSHLASVATASVAAPGRGDDRRAAAYGRIVSSSRGGVWLQYWLYYPRQEQDRGIFHTGRHAGDWEMVQYRLDRSGAPVEAVYAQHSGAERCAWAEVEQRHGRPVIYAARGSHASYFRSGTRDRMWPDPNDEANGRGLASRPHMARVTASSPAWMQWPGRWGGARARWWVPGEQDSPRGPAHQPQGRWHNPDGWARAAKPCRADCNAVDECDGTETALGAGGIAASVGLLAYARVRRRRRSSRSTT